MRHDKYRYNNTEEVVYYLKKYQRVKEEWQADFYDAYGRHMLTFESSDEETMRINYIPSLRNGWILPSWLALRIKSASLKSKLRAYKKALCESIGLFVIST